MNTIFKIARAELRSLFYSPVAWFLLIIFLIQCGYFYTTYVYGMARGQEAQLKSAFFTHWDKSLTMSIFLRNGFITSIIKNLYLYIPLLTMGMFSRDINNGSIKLYYSSPIKTRHIVFGKYLALLAFSLLLLLIVGIFMIAANFNIIHVENGMLLSAALGLFLLICAYMAIGFFMASLTTHQIVAAIATFLVIFIFTQIGTLWQEIDFVRDLTYFLSMPGRTRNLINGLITSVDVLYFVLIVSMFIGFTLVKLKSNRESKPWYVTAGKYMGIVVVVLTIGYITSRPQTIQYCDTTHTQSHTIHPQVQGLLKELGDDPLEVTLYVNLLGENYQPGRRAGRNLYIDQCWAKYIRFKHNILLKYEYYYDAEKDQFAKLFPGKSIPQIAKDMAIARDVDLKSFQTPAQIRKKINLAPEGRRLVMQLKYRNKTTFLRTFPDMVVWPSEDNIAGAILRLINTTPPKLLFITDNLERSIDQLGDRGYTRGINSQRDRTSFINYGFDIDTISLDTQELPKESANVTAMILADPKTELSATKKQKIQEYIDGGGNMLIMGEPGKADILNPVLEPLGVQLLQGSLIQLRKHNVPDIISSGISTTPGKIAEESRKVLLKNISIPSEKDIQQESVIPIVEMEHHTTFNKMPLVVARPDVWLKRGPLVKDSVPPVFNENEGDLKSNSFVTSMILTRQIKNKEQRIAIIGDADVMSNKYSGIPDDFSKPIIRWLDYNECPIHVPGIAPKDNLLTVTPETATLLKKIFVWILPAILTLIGIVVLVRRKRK